MEHLSITAVDKKVADLVKDLNLANTVVLALDKTMANADPSDNWTEEELTNLFVDKVWDEIKTAWDKAKAKPKPKSLKDIAAKKADAKAVAAKVAKEEKLTPAEAEELHEAIEKSIKPEDVAAAKAKAAADKAAKAKAEAAKPKPEPPKKLAATVQKFFNDKIAKSGIAAVLKAYKNDVADKTPIGLFLLDRAKAEGAK